MTRAYGRPLLGLGMAAFFWWGMVFPALAAPSPQGAAPPTAASGGLPGCDQAMLAAVQRAYQSLAGFESRFVQTDQPAAGPGRSSAGLIEYQRPGKMRWAYDPPDDQLLVTDGHTVWLYDPLLDNVTLSPLSGMASATPLAFLLGAGRLEKDFTCRPLSQAAPADGRVWLELVSRQPIPGVAYILLGVRRGDHQLEALRVVDTSGGWRTVELKGLKVRSGFPSGRFTFVIKPGMEVISR